MTPKTQWITGNTAGYYLNTDEHKLRQFRSDQKNESTFRESKTSTPTHRMYEYKIGVLKEYFKTDEEVPERLVRD